MGYLAKKYNLVYTIIEIKEESMESKNTKIITKKIEGNIWEEAKEKAYKIASKKVKVDGFRPGKAPKEVFLKKYGEESLFYDAANEVIEGAYEDVIKENNNLEIVARPEIGVKNIDTNGVEFEFTFTLKPEVTLGKYKGLEVEKENVEVTEEEIEKTIEEMRHHYTENVVKEGKIENGDLVILDFEGFKDNVPFEGGKAENYSLTIGSHTFIPGFEEALIGLEKDEQKDIHVTFPEDYHQEDLKGAPAIFKVKIHEIKTPVVPDLNEDFFADLAMEGVNSKESLVKVVRENIQTQKEVNAENKYLDALLEEAVKDVKVEIPHPMIHDEIDRMIKQYEQNLQMQGISLDQFYKFTNSDENALRDQMHEEAEKRVKMRLMLEEIAKVENIEVTDEEAKKETTKLAEKYHMKEDEFLKEFGGIDMVKYDIKMRTAMDILKK